LNRFRLAALAALASACVWLPSARPAQAAAEIHKLNLVLSAIPSQVAGGNFNDVIDIINRTQLEPRGNQGLDHIGFAWLFGAELRYFARPNFTLQAGFSQLRAETERTFLPGIGLQTTYRGEMLSVPIHVGGTYYFTPYNQGDFQARAYLGGGLQSLVYNKATFQVLATVPDTLTGSTKVLDAKQVFTQDAPGWYGEFGVHMFFAARYSVILGGYYRSSFVRNMELDANGQHIPSGLKLDMSGIGARMALGIGL